MEFDTNVLEEVKDNPETSARTIAARTGISGSKVHRPHRLLQRQQYHPYHEQSERREMALLTCSTYTTGKRASSTRQYMRLHNDGSPAGFVVLGFLECGLPMQMNRPTGSHSVDSQKKCTLNPYEILLECGNVFIALLKNEMLMEVQEELSDPL
ncbi:hypothetical protein J6590_047798 [Homalodisca vitripennis]|nr:hypothetical protein J6590_047798 [Homalodisca vitripennis]